MCHPVRCETSHGSRATPQKLYIPGKDLHVYLRGPVLVSHNSCCCWVRSSRCASEMRVCQGSSDILAALCCVLQLLQQTLCARLVMLHVHPVPGPPALQAHLPGIAEAACSMPLCRPCL